MISQNVAPAPVRQDSTPSRNSNGGGSDSSKEFGQVYDKAGHGNQSSAGSSTSAGAEKGNQAGGASASSNGAADSNDKTSTSKAADAVAKFALEGKAHSAKGDPLANGKAAKETAANADAVAHGPQDAKSAAANAAKAAAEKGAQAPAAAAQKGSKEAVAQLLGAQVAAKTHGKSLKGEAGGDGEVSAKKDAKEKDKDKSAGSDATDDKATQAANLAAGAIVIQPVRDKASSKDSGERVYRFSRADGSGHSVDLPLEKDKGSSEKGGKVEHISVLESRRFLSAGEGGLSANTKALLSGMSGDKGWAAAMKAASSSHVQSEAAPAPSTPLNTLKIQMNPQNLGAVTATLRLKGDELSVHLSVESGEAFRQLSADKDGLVNSLKSQGYSVDKVNIQLTTVAHADKGAAQPSSSSQQQSGQQQSSGQQMQGGSAGQFAQQGRGQENNRRQQANGFSDNWQQGDKIAGVEPAGSAADTGRAGQVYL
jgi:chemotaxis protein MotD